MKAAIKRPTGLIGAALAIVAGAAVLRVISGVGFANYDTLYALAWGGQLSRGDTPAYGVSIAPTPHPLVEALGVVLAPLGPGTVQDVTVALGFLALAACGWVIYRLGREWFGWAAGALAAVVFLTRVPVLSYGVRAYIDVPYLLLVLSALLVETRRRRAGAPALALLALAGLLRPEAWAFSGLYWLYLTDWLPTWARRTPAPAASGAPSGEAGAAEAASAGAPSGEAASAGAVGAGSRRSARELTALAALALAAPLVWVVSDLAVSGDPLWSLTNTRDTARALDRVTGITNVPEYIPRRIGEILRPPVLVGAALGGVLSLLWLRRRALVGALAGVVAVVVFAAFATIGLPINTRYGFLAAAILCIFCGAGVFGWRCLERGDPHRGWWMAGGALVVVALIAYAPAQYRSAHGELEHLARQQSIQNDLLALVRDRALTLGCGPVGVPNRAPVPLLALYMRTSPVNIVNTQVHQISRGEYLDPASKEVEARYVLDLERGEGPDQLRMPLTIPPGFIQSASNRSWLIFRRCS